MIARWTVVTLFLLAGCASPRAPDASLAAGATHTLYVVVDAGHTGLAVPAAEVPRDAWPARVDFPDADYLELGWGEREYYTREGNTLWLALRALFWSEASAIHVVGLRGDVAAAFPDAEIRRVTVSREGFGRLVAFVSASHERDQRGRGIVLGPGQRPGSLFYASRRRFHIGETCNTWVARGLREAGVAIDPRWAFTSTGLLAQLRSWIDER